MHAHNNYTITIDGAEAAIQAIGQVLKSVITDVEFDIGNSIDIYETYDSVFEDDMCELARAMAKAAPDTTFVMEGVIDTSESAGEYKDFRFVLAEGRLTAAFSDWYREECMEFIESYEEFCECVTECTEEAYETYKGYEFLYILETEDGEVYSDHVPLHDPMELVC